MARKKIIIGIPTYGRGWTLDDPEIKGLGSLGTPANATRFVGEAGVGAYYEVGKLLLFIRIYYLLPEICGPSQSYF